MGRQNVYDNHTFFEQYKKLRAKKAANANDLVEIPALFSLLPNVAGKQVLDLGCGYGGHCYRVAKLGAKKVVGVDISKKMLEEAKRQYTAPVIEYKNLAMENLAALNDSFDMVISSLALHYVEDFKTVVRDVYRLLNQGGYFIFSQEHPINSCFSTGDRWTRDAEGNKLFANVKDYSTDGPRESEWFIEGVVKYHRTFSTIINTLVEAGFTIEKILEPIPSEMVMHDFPRFSDTLHKPDFLLIKAYKA